MITKINVKNKEYTVLNGAVEITYAELKALRDNSKLVAGTNYIITDYEFTTSTFGTTSGGHQFDIIVTADSPNTLNENARARKHEGDTYFAECDLSAWQLKYSLDNAQNRFDWADEENGKGVIFWLKDEWNNECPYDFKNLIYQGKKGFIYNQWGTNYTFARDESLDVTLTENFPAGPGLYCGYRCGTTPSAWSDNICYTYGEATLKTTSLFNSSLSLISYGGEITSLLEAKEDAYTFGSSDATIGRYVATKNTIIAPYCYTSYEPTPHKVMSLNFIKISGSDNRFIECQNIEGTFTNSSLENCQKVFGNVNNSFLKTIIDVSDLDCYNCEFLDVANCVLTNAHLSHCHLNNVNSITIKPINSLYTVGLYHWNISNIFSTTITFNYKDTYSFNNYELVNIVGQTIDLNSVYVPTNDSGSNIFPRENVYKTFVGYSGYLFVYHYFYNGIRMFYLKDDGTWALV